jgi:hypothetical protein
MAGVHFSFYDFPSLLQLNMGISERLDENRKESFTVLYCDFSDLSKEIITQSLEQVLRDSDAIVHYDQHYFFVLLYTDKYGAMIVKDMFEEFFDTQIPSSEVSYPADGDSPGELLETLHAKVYNLYTADLDFLSPNLFKKESSL